MKHALVNSENVVVSVIVWPNSDYRAPKDHRALSVDTTKIGDTLDEENMQTKKSDGAVRESVTLVS